ncbi:MAG: diacylglycerol/lipid kinase family protein [Thermoguttaceae bacterium]
MPFSYEPLSPEADRVVISVNPKAGARSADARVAELAESLRERGMTVEVDSLLSSVAEAATCWHGEGRLRALVGVGGDGTAAELVNRTPPGLPVAMLPSGNENLLARYVGWEKGPAALCSTLMGGRRVRLDAGRANGRLFLLMAGCGFDAHVVRQVHARRTGHIRSRHYFKPILHSMRTYKYPSIEFAGEAVEPSPGAEATVSDAARWLFVFNMPCYGGGLRIAPQADPSDEKLDVCEFRRGGFLHGIRYAGGILLGRHQRMRDVVVQRVRRLTISSNAEVPYQLDGDPGGVLPLEIESVPQRLTLVVPSET